MANTSVTLPDGRRLGLFSAGDPAAARIVMICHPSPGTATFDPDPTVSDRWGVHLVALDRPGYGSSDPLPAGAEHRIAGRAEDLVQYLQQVERSARTATRTDLGRIGVIGWGTGAVVAAAIASHRPDLVDRLALIGPPAPRTAADLVRRASVAEPSIAALGIADDDPDLTRHLGLLGRVDRMVSDACTQGSAGVDADAALLTDPTWPDQVRGITASTRIWLGDRDPVVREDDVRWWADRLPDVHAVHVEDSGPLTIAAAWRHVLAHVAPEHGSLPEQERDGQDSRIAGVDPVHPDRR